MDDSTASLDQLLANSRTLARRVLTIGENRLELLAVELQQERQRLLHDLLFALAAATCGLLAGITLTATVAVCFWAYSPGAALLLLSLLYAATTIGLVRQLRSRLARWQPVPSSMEQLRKDRECLNELLK